MIRSRHSAWLTASLLASAAVITLTAPYPAAAQAPTPSFGQPPNPFITTVRPGAQPRRAVPAPVEESTRAPQPGDPEQTGDPTLDPPEPERRILNGRRPVIDGDPSWPAQPTQPVDGVMETPTTEQPIDGVDPTVVDTRSEEEYGPFELPRSAPETTFTDDPAIELEPILDRRPARLARFEPFDAVGIRRGGFIIFPEIESSVVGIDNLYRSSSNVRRDVMLEVRPQVRVVSNWRRHAVEFRATGLSTFHADFPGEDDRAYGFEARGRIDISRRTNVEAFAGIDRSQERRGAISAVNRGGGDRAEVDTRRTGVAFNHRFNRLSIQLRGTVTDVDYSGVNSEAGTFVTNDDRDVRTREIAMRAQWDFKPTFAIFGETAFNWRDYGGTPGDGINRESQGERVRLGVSFGTTSQRLRGEVSIGHGHQQFQDSRLPEIRGIIVDSNLAWRVSGLTSLLLTARTDVGESTLAGSGGALSRTAGLEVRHAFKRQLIGTAGVRTTHQEYEGVNLTEREIAALLGLEYYVNREVTVFTRYQHINFESTQIDRNYNADEVRVGVRVRR